MSWPFSQGRVAPPQGAWPLLTGQDMLQTVHFGTIGVACDDTIEIQPAPFQIKDERDSTVCRRTRH
jgi:hypothetical protein